MENFSEGFMDEKKYTSFSIPQREALTAKEDASTAPNVATCTAATAAGIAAGFAEIEYETQGRRNTSAEKAVQFFSSVTPPQTIARKAVDPIRQRFFDMRNLASDKPFARNDSELFYKQGKFMEDFEDDYQGDAKLNMYYPYYQHMGYEQLRTYFTWRTKIRRGEIQPIGTSYAFLYIYELLSNIGVKDAADGLDKLTVALNEYIMFAPALERHLPKWIKDYCIYYELPHSFKDYVKEHDLYMHFPEMFLFEADVENRLELWSGISGYSVTDSKFYRDGNQQLLRDCYNAVFDAVRKSYADGKARFEDLIVYRISNRSPWDPFGYALFYPWLRQADRKVELPGRETYYCKNNRWTSCHPIYFSKREMIAGYLVKKTEACLREAMKYKHKLKAISIYCNEILDALIGNAVAEFHRAINRTVVSVDHANLERIREEALGTQDKLIVPERDARDADGPTSHLSSVKSHFTLRSSPHEDWGSLKGTLDLLELQALRIALDDCTRIKSFADENGVMLEVLADGINEKAVDIIGDSILEVDEGMSVFDDYRGKVAEMVGL